MRNEFQQIFNISHDFSWKEQIQQWKLPGTGPHNIARIPSGHELV